MEKKTYCFSMKKKCVVCSSVMFYSIRKQMEFCPGCMKEFDVKSVDEGKKKISEQHYIVKMVRRYPGPRRSEIEVLVDGVSWHNVFIKVEKTYPDYKAVSCQANMKYYQKELEFN